MIESLEFNITKVLEIGTLYKTKENWPIAAMKIVAFDKCDFANESLEGVSLYALAT